MPPLFEKHDPAVALGVGGVASSPASVPSRPDPPSASDYRRYDNYRRDNVVVVEGRNSHYVDMNQLSSQAVAAISQRYHHQNLAVGDYSHDSARSLGRDNVSGGRYRNQQQEHHHSQFPQDEQYHFPQPRNLFPSHQHSQQQQRELRTFHQHAQHYEQSVNSGSHNSNRPLDESSVASATHYPTHISNKNTKSGGRSKRNRNRNLSLRWRMTTTTSNSENDDDIIIDGGDDDDDATTTTATTTDSLSDWKLLVVHSITGDSKIYHVHRVVLATGANNNSSNNNNNSSSSSHRGSNSAYGGRGTCCGYFKKLFLSSNKQQQHEVARLEEKKNSSSSSSKHVTFQERSMQLIEEAKKKKRDSAIYEEQEETTYDEKDDDDDVVEDTTSVFNSSSFLHAIKVTNMTKSSTTKIEFLHSEACDLFPIFLNHLYGIDDTETDCNDDEDDGEFSNGPPPSSPSPFPYFKTRQVVGLYFLAKYFQHYQLQQLLIHEYIVHSIRTAIGGDDQQHDRDTNEKKRFENTQKILLDYIQQYYHDAIYFDRRELLDLLLLEIAVPNVIRYIQPDCSFLYEMSPTFFVQLITMATSANVASHVRIMNDGDDDDSPSRRPGRLAASTTTSSCAASTFSQGDQYHISTLVAEYCSIHCHIQPEKFRFQSDHDDENEADGDEENVTYEMFQQLTSRERLPVLDARAALKLLVLEQHFLLKRRKQRLLSQGNTVGGFDGDEVGVGRRNEEKSSSPPRECGVGDGDETQEYSDQLLNQRETKQHLQQLLLQQLPSCLQQRCIDTLAQRWVEVNEMESDVVAMALQQLPNSIVVRILQSVLKVSKKQQANFEVDFTESLKREQYWKASFDRALEERDLAIEEVNLVNTHLQTTKSEVKGQLSGLVKRNESSKEEWLAERQYWLDQRDVWNLEREEYIEEQESFQREKQRMKQELREAKREISKLKKRLAAANSDESTYAYSGGKNTLVEIMETAFSFDNGSYTY